MELDAEHIMMSEGSTIINLIHVHDDIKLIIRADRTMINNKDQDKQENVKAACGAY